MSKQAKEYSMQTINLPTPCIVGDVFALHGKGNGLFKVVQRAGEQIVLDDKQMITLLQKYAIEKKGGKDDRR